MKNIYVYQTDIGKIGIAETQNVITNLFLPGEDIPEDFITHETEILHEASQQLKKYFLGSLKDFSLPLAPDGTEFMRRVWASLQVIPYGQTRSYKEIAHSIGNGNAARAVGMANNRNPIPIIIPCHRVIGANGNLIGYGGGLSIKAFLLDMEKRYGSL